MIRDAIQDRRQRLLAWIHVRGDRRYEAFMDGRKRSLLGSLRGRVLEIGPGTGVNLRYYDPAIEWIGLEPNPHMHAHLIREAERLGLRPELRPDPAERIDVDDGAVDAVVSTLVLCSVPDPRHVLAEIARILRPGGRFVFVEHVVAPSGTPRRAVQRIVKLPWRLFGDGCRVDRDTAATLREVLGSERGFTVEHEAFLAPLPVVSPHIAGVAVKPCRAAPVAGALSCPA